ncbi:MAG: hypothetical protein A3J48_03580 [Candidatus Doudnabacteria bacterium RIFCSPHIGHO2_02_FULL_46_11]|uniref:Transcobalamin-like C-terminal domain-containing protein n=1 Tax=Candidatus Doudnabacteria bacterium RIFCSPHIGHO2_02_FULL_46_11 TaxID=1817832 RepID=A0A1F5P3U5_9BACT|nr:MAG: hypothetical protein A3J48_03580 [Candidatus Doudnabacteria bacterium RIFCSPHIGHO2_02_FULL_46_11]
MNDKRVLSGIIALAVILGLLFVTDGRVADRGLNQTEEAASQTVNEISYRGAQGQTALALLRQGHQVTTKEFTGLGEFVTAIDGVEAGSSHFWAFYVNDQMAQVGADQYVTREGDRVVWKLEEIK